MNIAYSRTYANNCLALLMVLFTCFASAQTDSSRTSKLDTLSAEALGKYYENEPEPIQFYKGPDTGDSAFYKLQPLVVPTETVEAEALSIHRRAKAEATGVEEPEEEEDTASTGAAKLKPKISLGGGSLSFNGDMNARRFQPPSTGRLAAELGISHRITRYLQLDFFFLIGKLGANEMLYRRQENFQSEIRGGGVSLLYDFGNFIPDEFRIRPFVSFGVMGFEFLSKTDLKDRNGNTYYYWSDGSIRDMAQGSGGAQDAHLLNRDYTYESDIRELNKDGFGKYPERAWSFPLGFGGIIKLTDRLNLKMGFQYFFSTTDYIDGITDKSVGNRVGNKRKDNFAYTSISLQYDLIAKFKKKKKGAEVSNEQWLAIDKEDRDKDGVPDLADACAGTPDAAKVDVRGCPLDGDADGIPDYRDDELNTGPGLPVNGKGVAVTDEALQNWYNAYMNDSLDLTPEVEQTDNIYADLSKKKAKKKKKDTEEYTVELVRYNGSIPSDELAFLLSIGDINSSTLPDGTTVVYTSGNYDKLALAMKRRDEFRTSGNKGAGISKIVGKDIVQIPEDELQRLLKGEMEDLLNVNVDSLMALESFGKNDIVYRVQLGAFKKRISTSVFNTSAGVLELKTGESIFRYVTKGYKSIEEAAATRADLVIQGYSDAFVTAYRAGKRVPLNQTSATVDKSFQEDMSEDKMFSSVDKKLLVFKVQLGPLKKKTQEAIMDEKTLLLSDVEKQITPTGSIRYTAGIFQTPAEAESYKHEVEENGFRDAFVIATFKGEIISLQEAMELMK